MSNRPEPSVPEYTVTLKIKTLDHGDPNFWDWNAIMEDLVWSIEVVRNERRRLFQSRKH